MKTQLVWITPEAEQFIGYMARVSNPANQTNNSVNGLIRYMVKHQHWSPFEMVNAVFEIETTRDIGRQILRHRSFSFQEFSQRYADAALLPEAGFRECRIQDQQNRQNSLTTEDTVITNRWDRLQKEVYETARASYQSALLAGIAKEQARALLPEGLTTSRMYMNGTIRSWIHYCQLRCEAGTQKEHRLIAESISTQLAKALPIVWAAIS